MFRILNNDWKIIANCWKMIEIVVKKLIFPRQFRKMSKNDGKKLTMIEKYLKSFKITQNDRNMIENC